MNLQIPYAYKGDTVNFVSPNKAQKGQDFRCIECDAKLILRKGKIRVPHFAHKHDTICTGEGVIHKVAKLILYSIFYTSFHRLKKSVVGIRRKCPHCGLTAYVKAPDGFCDIGVVGTEWTIKDLGGKNRRVDVLVGERQDDGRIAPALAIEIRSKHPVPEEKWDALKARGIPCIDVEAQDIIDAWVLSEFTNINTPWFRLNPVRQNLYIHDPDDPGVIGDRLPYIKCPRCSFNDEKLEGDTEC